MSEKRKRVRYTLEFKMEAERAQNPSEPRIGTSRQFASYR